MLKLDWLIRFVAGLLCSCGFVAILAILPVKIS